jgi:hypothetical protein
MEYTPRESTVPNESQLEQKAARYAELHPGGSPAKPRRLPRLLHRLFSGSGAGDDRSDETDARP